MKALEHCIFTHSQGISTNSHNSPVCALQSASERLNLRKRISFASWIFCVHVSHLLLITVGDRSPPGFGLCYINFRVVGGGLGILWYYWVSDDISHLLCNGAVHRWCLFRACFLYKQCCLLTNMIRSLVNVWPVPVRASMRVGVL